MNRFEGKVVVVTGASSGVGRAIVRAFADEGAHLGLIARSIDGLEGAASEVRTSGGRALVLPLDVADSNAVERAAARVEDDLGPIDIWVNNAMVSVFSPISEMSADEFKSPTNARARHRDHHSDQFGARVSIDPATERVLRVKGRPSRIH